MKKKLIKSIFIFIITFSFFINKVTSLTCTFDKAFTGVQGYKHAYWLYGATTRDMIISIVTDDLKEPWGSFKYSSEVPVYFCLQRGEGILHAKNPINIVVTDQNKPIFAAIGNIIEEYINTSDPCVPENYEPVQRAIHRFVKWISSNLDCDVLDNKSICDYFEEAEVVGGPYLPPESTYFENAKDEYNNLFDFLNSEPVIRSINGNEISSLSFQLNSNGKYRSNYFKITFGDLTSSVYGTTVVFGNQKGSLRKDSNGYFIEVPQNKMELIKDAEISDVSINFTIDYYLPSEMYEYPKHDNIEVQAVAKAEVEEDQEQKSIELSFTITENNNVTIKKVNSSGTIITGKPAKFKLYEGSNCAGAVMEQSFTVTGTKTLYLEPNKWYSLRETEAPSGYKAPLTTNCTNFYVDGSRTNNEVTIENESTCVSDVLEGLSDNNDISFEERINIYKTYNSNLNATNKMYTNLLNFNLKRSDYASNDAFADDLCKSDQKCSTRSNFNCLNVKNESIDFDEYNLSCYNNAITKNNKTGFCYLSFSFEKDPNWNSITLENGYTSIGESIKAGQFIIKNNSSNVVGETYLTQSCYFIGDPISGENKKITLANYNEFVSSINFSGIKPLNPTNPTLELSNASCAGYCLYKGSVKVLYGAPDVYVEKISGKKCSNLNDPSCVYIGTGLISNFYDAFRTADYKLINGTKYMPIPFRINFNSNILKNSFNKTSADCYYNLQPEIITYDNNENGELELEFRTIDTNNPFNRDTNANWCYNGDCSYNNERVQQYILDRTVNNSYNRTGNGPIYRIELTPSLINEIREYNAAKGRTYDNYELDCDKKGNCSNAFLKKFNIVKK